LPLAVGQDAAALRGAADDLADLAASVGHGEVSIAASVGSLHKMALAELSDRVDDGEPV
jgi:hypothetical protein